MIQVKLLTMEDFEKDCKVFENNMGREPNCQEKRERLYTYESRNIYTLRDAIYEYDHDTLEGYSIEAHMFTREVDEKLTSWDTSNIDSFNKMLLEVVEEWKGVQLELQ